MSPQIFPQIRMVILSLLDESGGMYKGTLRLAELIPADQHAVIRSLHGCQRDGLVRSIHTHGGAGTRPHDHPPPDQPGPLRADPKWQGLC